MRIVSKSFPDEQRDYVFFCFHNVGFHEVKYDV